MVDTPSSILLLRLQSTGSNLNTWGGYLNTALSTSERASKGYQAYTVTGDATLTWANYSATNDFSVAMAKAGGSPTAAWTITHPSYANFFGVWNNTSYTGTHKDSGGTGIAVPAGRRSLLYNDTTDIGEASPNWLSNYATTLANNGDIVVYATLGTYVAAAIAAASISNTGQLLNSVTDTTSGYNTTKNRMSSDSLLTYTTRNAGANEYQELSDRRVRRRALFVGF
jgi:hypothetical protein